MQELSQMPGHLIRRLNQISVSVFANGMKRAGLDLTPVQFAALSALSAEPGIDQATLAGRIAYDRVTIGGVVDRLEGKGLLAREVSPTDRRARILRLTDQGAKLLVQASPVVAALQPEILSGLTEAEHATFLALLRKVTVAGNTRSRAPLLPRDA